MPTKLTKLARDPLGVLFASQQPVGGQDLPGARSIPVVLLDPNPYQARRRMDPAALAELAASIRAHGVLQPLAVRRDGDRYQIIAGERRWRAAQQAGHDAVPCLVCDIGDEDTELLALIENIQREELDPVDEADAYARLLARLGCSARELAARLGKTHEYVAARLRLLSDPEVEEAVRAGQLGPTAADAVLRLDVAQRREMLARVRDGAAVTVQQIKELRRRGRPTDASDEGLTDDLTEAGGAQQSEGRDAGGEVVSDNLTAHTLAAGALPEAPVDAPRRQTVQQEIARASGRDGGMGGQLLSRVRSGAVAPAPGDARANGGRDAVWPRGAGDRPAGAVVAGVVERDARSGSPRVRLTADVIDLATLQVFKLVPLHGTTPPAELVEQALEADLAAVRRRRAKD